MALAIGGAVGLYLFLAWLLGVSPHLGGSVQPALPAADQQKLLADLVKIALGLAAGIGAAFALVVGYRRARTDEAGSHRDDRRLFSSRYQDAADLIGSDKAAVRLAGIYAMARLADDWVEQRQQCIDVLCAYLRLPYEPDPDTGDLGEREVRYSVIALISGHLQPSAEPSWRGRLFDFNGAVFDGGDFRGAQFAGGLVIFSGAEFTGGLVDFSDARFTRGKVEFRGARFTGATVSFHGARITGGMVDFAGARFTRGTAHFDRAQLTGGTLNFSGAKFTGATVQFRGAEFAGCEVWFDNAVLTAGTLAFQRARFTPDPEFPWNVLAFADMRFTGGTVDFRRAEFAGGSVDFPNAKFTGSSVDFRQAAFTGGVVDFGRGSSPRDDFRGAEFAGGTMDFDEVVLYDGGVDFSDTTPGPDSATRLLNLPAASDPHLTLPSWLAS
ncbi:pentapeptide repeat-containing protein [Kribbella sp. CA-253562]|uniref:pentapeptide repeat-containing protein n=1 Tax=Kribbella sp. CA-253562 TaxID=3239942 RepID=UPI003D8EE233